MNSDKKSSELARLRRQHQLVCSVIAALLICAGIYGTVARLGFILMAPLFVIALGVLVDAFLPRVSWFFCVRDVRHIWVEKTIVAKLKVYGGITYGAEGSSELSLRPQVRARLLQF